MNPHPVAEAAKPLYVTASRWHIRKGASCLSHTARRVQAAAARLIDRASRKRWAVSTSAFSHGGDVCTPFWAEVARGLGPPAPCEPDKVLYATARTWYVYSRM